MGTRFGFSLLVAAALAAMPLASVWADGTGSGRPAGGARRLPGQVGPADVGGGAALKERRQRNDELTRVGRRPSQASPPAPSRPAPARPTPTPTLVHMHHGTVHMGAGLARVQLTLEVQNVGPQALEWQRTYAIDPAAEVIGAVLMRTDEAPIRARTLTDMDAGRIYSRIRTPPPSRNPENRDPLLVSRPQADRLAVRIWPIAPQEIIRVELTFVTPLRGNGARRTYRDVMGGPLRPDRPRPVSRPEEAPVRERPVATVGAKADWLMHPGELVLSSAQISGMTYGGEAGGRLHFTGAAATEPRTPAPHVEFLKPSRTQHALLVGNGTYRGRIATWRFDPREFLGARGYALTEGLQVKLVPTRGSCRRLAPAVFACTDEPRPVTALVSKRDASEVEYTVLLLDRDGDVLERFAQSRPLRRAKVSPEIEGAVSGWHRAALVKRVFHWAAAQQDRREAAQRFAVDLGVLVPGTSALAVPNNERVRMTATDRRLYDHDGVPLGAQKHESDLRRPPRGSLDD